MPKIIFPPRPPPGGPPTQLENYVRYIGTREGVEKSGSEQAVAPGNHQSTEFNPSTDP